jgi:hypothetical protein
MPRRIDDRYVYKRYLNGACRIDRICKECGRKYIGERNICPTCRDKGRHEKFGATYHKRYYHRNLSKSVIQKENDQPAKQGQMAQLRKAAFEKQKARIRAEMAAIVCAGLDPNEDSIERIEQAGVKLSECRIENLELRMK